MSIPFENFMKTFVDNQNIRMYIINGKPSKIGKVVLNEYL